MFEDLILWTVVITLQVNQMPRRENLDGQRWARGYKLEESAAIGPNAEHTRLRIVIDSVKHVECYNRIPSY